MASPERWVKVAEGSAITPGTYKLTGTVLGGYNPVTRETVKRGLQLGLEAKGNKLTTFNHYAPVFNSDGTQGPWVFVARFDRPAVQPPVQAGFDVRAVLVIVGAVIVLGLGLKLVRTDLEKLIVTVGEQVRETLGPVLSPGTLVLGAFALWLIFRRA